MSYMFNNMGRIGMDATDKTQQTLYNTRMANYTVSNFFAEAKSDSHVNFATMQPTVNFNGSGVGGAVVDFESLLKLQNEQERPLDKVQLMQRPFATVPYLGRGAGNPDVESQLLQGELVHGKKTVSTVTEQSFMNYMMPADAMMQERVANTAYTVQESALDGWVRGGASTRDLSSK